jgi:hypothetical protein
MPIELIPVAPEDQPQPAATVTDDDPWTLPPLPPIEERAQRATGKSCGQAARHLDRGAKFEPGDRVLVDGLYGTAAPCRGCGGQALVLDPDELQPAPWRPDGVTDADELPPPATVREPEDRRASLATSREARDQAADEILDAMAGHGLAAATGSPLDDHDVADGLRIARILKGPARDADRPLGALDPDQRARVVALREVGDGFPDATVDEVIALTDYIVTGIYAGQAAR